MRKIIPLWAGLFVLTMILGCKAEEFEMVTLALAIVIIATLILSMVFFIKECGFESLLMALAAFLSTIALCTMVILDRLFPGAGVPPG